MICFNADAFLEPVLESILPFGKVIVTEGPVGYWQSKGFTTSTDKTNEILQKYIPVENRLHGTWAEKNDMMQAAESLIPKDTTHVWMVDADEIYTAETIQLIAHSLDDYDSVSFIPYTCYGGFERYLTGFEQEFEWIRIQRWRPDAHWYTHRPPTVLDERGRPYRSRRHLVSREHFFHYSYVLPKQVQSKIEYYTSWGAGVIPHYFERVYLKWMHARTGHERQQIEREFHGVHEWLPQRRTDCFTAQYMGRHPHVIRERISKYTTRMQIELATLFDV